MVPWPTEAPGPSRHGDLPARGPGHAGLHEPPANHPDSHVRVGDLGCVRDRPRSGGHPGTGADVGDEPPGRPRRARCPHRHSRPRPEHAQVPEEAIRARAARRRRRRGQRSAIARAAQRLRLGAVRLRLLRSIADQERARLRAEQPHRALRATHALRRSVHGRRRRRRARRELPRVLHADREDRAWSASA